MTSVRRMIRAIAGAYPRPSAPRRPRLGVTAMGPRGPRADHPPRVERVIERIAVGLRFAGHGVGFGGGGPARGATGVAGAALVVDAGNARRRADPG